MRVYLSMSTRPDEHADGTVTVTRTLEGATRADLEAQYLAAFARLLALAAAAERVPA